ncbi:FRG domain-containing protein [Lonsdalea quercina]|uniref:FRG domain-containing protein n=1 Tax=Lonsdalea quercina TaxID=71657 RepID=UPI00397608C7
MFNLFITSDSQAWADKNGNYDLIRSRFLEHTEERLAEKYIGLTDKQIEEIKNMPCLFLHEKLEGDAFIGKLSSIAADKYKIEIEYNIHSSIKEGSLSYDDLKSLGISKFETMRTHWAIKDRDLLKTLKTNNIEINKINPIKKIDNPTENNTVIRGVISDVIKPTKIRSLHSFIKNVLSKTTKKDHEKFYRGHCDFKYKLEPSINRKNNSADFLYRKYENVMATELLVENPNDFSADRTTLEKLVRMQHYSLPTRLLDITSNPLMALYFACTSQDESTDGQVIIFSINQESIKYFDSDTVSCLANISRLSVNDRESVGNAVQNGEYLLSDEELASCKNGKYKDDANLKITKFNERHDIGRLIHFIKEDKSSFMNKIIPNDLENIFCVKGKKSNGRIISQSGCFLLFGTEMNMPEFGTPEIEIERINIDRNSKNQILEDLDKMNINESTVYPYIENSAKYIKKKYERKLNEESN